VDFHHGRHASIHVLFWREEEAMPKLAPKAITGTITAMVLVASGVVALSMPNCHINCPPPGGQLQGVVAATQSGKGTGGSPTTPR
jgi:hypothetical protein